MSSYYDLAPCGTYNARRRHRRHNETCETCGPIKPVRPLAPCGTKAARTRHRKHGETCQECAQTPPPKAGNLKPCGTPAAAKRHRSKNEPVCEPCLTAERNQATEERRTRGIPERLTTAELIQEARFLVNAGEGTHRILQALGYEGRTDTLRQRLAKAGQQALAAQILNPWDLAA